MRETMTGAVAIGLRTMGEAAGTRRCALPVST